MVDRNDSLQTNILFRYLAGLKSESRPTTTKLLTKITTLSFGPNSDVRVPLKFMVASGSKSRGTNESRNIPPTKQNMTPINEPVNNSV
jgi:hypothetical protein